MRIEVLKLADVIPYENNPRRNDQAVEAVAESIRQCSYVQPIIVDEAHVILAGHSRRKALERLGVAKVACLIVEGLTEEQKKKYRYLDNKTAEAAEWDLRKLEDELEGLDLGGLDFFNMAGEVFEVRGLPDYTGAAEIDLEEFEDEKFRFECPGCGFRFN